MADEEQTHEQGILGSFYKKWQATSMDAFQQVNDKYTKNNKQELQEGSGKNVSESLSRQAGFLRDANESLEGVGGEQRFDSESSYAAATERGIQKKMKALGMLDQATEEIGYDPMVAEFKDPVTGETVDADSFDYNSDRALKDSIRNDIRGAQNANFSQASSVNRIIRGQRSSIGQDNSYNHRNGYSELTDSVKNDFTNLFGEENGEHMSGLWKEGRFDMVSLSTQLREIQNTTNSTAWGMTDAIKGGYNDRAQSAIDHADDYNTTQNYAKQEGDKQSSEAADAKSEIRQSINSDKQNLARRSAGDVGGGTRKARINYDDTNGGGSRPV